MSAEARWTIVVIVLAIAGVVALWSGDAGDSTTAEPLGIPTDRVTVQQDDVELAPARAAAGLADCPAPTGLTGEGASAGVVVPCLGQPGRVQLSRALAGRPVLLDL